MKVKRKKTKYNNRKTVVDGIEFDSAAEAEYYRVAKAYAKKNGLELRLQEKFVLQEKYRIHGVGKRAITYTPDFTFWDGDKLVRVVDVKGMQTESFKIKAKIFCYKYQIPLVLAVLDSRSGMFKETNF